MENMEELRGCPVEDAYWPPHVSVSLSLKWIIHAENNRTEVPKEQMRARAMLIHSIFSKRKRPGLYILGRGVKVIREGSQSCLGTMKDYYYY